MRLTEQKRLDSDAIKANLRGKLSDENRQKLQNEINDECRKIENALKAIEYERKSLLQAAQQTKLENVSFVKTWRDKAVQAKIELQQALFPDGFVRSAKMGYLDHQNKWLIEDLLPIFQEFSQKTIFLEKFIVKFGVPDGI